jgi:aminoglycoside phosphotransferase family enzyme
MLDRLLREHGLKRGELERAIELLSRFYRDATRADMPSARYRTRFAEEIAENQRELMTPAYELSSESIEATCARQLSVLAIRADLFDARAERIVEAHGDLRPEHVCLEDPPKIIDCLEFSRELRLLDPADELSFLALECARLGWPELASTIFGTYTAVTGDAPHPMLLDFYRSFRACVRARIAIRHLADASPREPARWSAQARAYLALAREHIEGCTATSFAHASDQRVDDQPAQ